MFAKSIRPAVRDSIRSLRPRVFIANVRPSPPMTVHVRCQLAKLVRELQAERAKLWLNMLEPYGHPVHRIGACQLFPADNCGAHRFRSHEVVSYFVSVFEAAALLANSELSRFDLHHAHMYFNASQNELGLLFHCKEYPAFDDRTFPFNLGYCQMGSGLALGSDDSMNFRTVLWTFGGDNVILLEGPDREPFGTIYEQEFGDSIADFYYFCSQFGWKDEGLNRGLHIVPYIYSIYRSLS